MNTELTFSLLKSKNTERCEKFFHAIHEWSPSDWGLAMAGECGEACNFIKKLRRTNWDYKNNQDLVKNIGKELADIIFYVDLCATSLNIDLEQEIIDKFNEVSDRVNCDIKIQGKNHQLQ